MYRLFLLLTLLDIAKHFGMNHSYQLWRFELLLSMRVDNNKSIDGRSESVGDGCNDGINEHIVINGDTSHLEAISDLDHLIKMLVDLDWICAPHSVEFPL